MPLLLPFWMLPTALLTIVCILLITCTSPVLVNVAVLRKFLFSLLSTLTGVMCYSQQFESYTRAFRATCPWFSHQQLWNLHIKWKFILTRIFFFFDTFHCALNYTVTLESFASLEQSHRWGYIGQLTKNSLLTAFFVSSPSAIMRVYTEIFLQVIKYLLTLVVWVWKYSLFYFQEIYKETVQKIQRLKSKK